MRGSRAAGRLLAALVAIGLLGGGPALAFIPRAERVVKAVGDTNRASGRSRALQLELRMRIGDREPVASGELVTPPTGLARLELRGAGELVERHLLQGAEHRASRNGRMLDDAWAFLPPLFLLQASSAVTLRAALASFGIEHHAIGLAPCGDSTCYVLGDPDRVPPVAETDLTGAAAGSAAEPLFLETREDSSILHPTIWVDSESFEVRRIDSADGVRVFLGPPAAFGKLRVPGWLQIQQPGRPPVRFEVVEAAVVNAPAAAFSESWLLAPTGPGPDPPDDAPAAERAPVPPLPPESR